MLKISSKLPNPTTVCPSSKLKAIKWWLISNNNSRSTILITEEAQLNSRCDWRLICLAIQMRRSVAILVGVYPLRVIAISLTITIITGTKVSLPKLWTTIINLHQHRRQPRWPKPEATTSSNSSSSISNWSSSRILFQQSNNRWARSITLLWFSIACNLTIITTKQFPLSNKIKRTANSEDLRK